VLVLFGIRTHQRWMEQTRLEFTVTLQGQPNYDATITFDGKPATSGQKISLGSHIFTVTHPKGESFSTNLFVWYGEHDFGRIDLKRTMGTLTVTADPPADRLIIRGPEWSLTLTTSAGLTKLVPTDAYEIEAEYPHWQKKYEAAVFANQTAPCTIAPHFGGLKLGCNQSDATYQLLTLGGQLVSDGILPATVTELPAGNYKLTATHHNHQRTDTLAVKADTNTDAEFDFQYGVVLFETVPPGATIITDDGRSWGETPRTLIELLPGKWSFTLQRNGYQSVPLSLVVAANETNFVSTNLVSENYLHALTAARQYLAAADYEHALQAANAALVARPGDADAMMLQSEATGLGIIQHAKQLAKMGYYIEGGKELTKALQSLPDNTIHQHSSANLSPVVHIAIHASWLMKMPHF
jgi:PEGA domain